MICPKCGNVITHNSYFDAYYCPRCGEFIREKPPMTNADRIRAMSDEELCDLLDEWWCMGANNDERLAYADERLAWLQQPAEEDGHDERKENEHV